jgi:aspartokinase
VTGLSLVEVTIDSGTMASLGRALVQMGERGIHSQLTFSQPCSEGLKVCFLIQCNLGPVAGESLEQALRRDADPFTYQMSPAEIVFFHGPHFGDRYGIADVTVAALAGGGVQMVAVVCSGACIYIVLPEGKSEEAVRVLAATFEIPKLSLKKTFEASRTKP